MKGNSKMKDENLIKALNSLIEAAVCDGGDSGGAYHQNEGSLIESINIMLDKLELQDRYEVIRYEDNSHWSNYYVGRKREIN